MNKKVITKIDSLIPLIEESFSKNQAVTIKVKGTSMEPFLKDNQTDVTISPFNGELSKYEVYLYECNGVYLLHRYIKAQDDSLYFRGDALYLYEHVVKEDILGLVTSFTTDSTITLSSNKLYKLKVRVFLIKKAIKLLVRRIIKGR